MSISDFLPDIFENTDEFVAERVMLLVRRVTASLVLAACTSIGLIFLIYSRGDFGKWQLLVLSILISSFYAAPLFGLFRSIKTQQSGFADPQHFVKQLTGKMVMLIVAWDALAMMVLPDLKGDTRLIAIVLYVAIVLFHALPFSLFPRCSLLILLVSLLPMCVQLTLLDNPNLIPLGLTGIVIIFMEVQTIAWLYQTDMDNLRTKQTEVLVIEPDMSDTGIKNRVTTELYYQSVQSIFLQASMAFLLVIVLHNSETELLLWSWFLGFISVQTLRAAAFVAFTDNPETHSVLFWRRVFAAGLFAGQITWFILAFIFYDTLAGTSLGIIAGLFLFVAAITTLGLTIDKVLFQFNSLMCLLPPLLLMMLDLDILMVIALGIISALTLAIVVESVHRSSLRSLKGDLLKQLAEIRANKMQRLNIDLTLARKRLSQVNSTLESQVQERTRQLSYQANHDMLTGLGNRYRFSALVEEALEDYSNNRSGFVIYMLDLTRFKEINDGLGHFAGDQVLRDIAQRIQNACGKDRFCARWGGDEFVILQKSLINHDEIYHFTDYLVAQLLDPIELESGPVIVGASVGVSICPEHGITPYQLLEHADIAVYRSKMSKERVSIYNHLWGKEAVDRVKLAQALRAAIESNSLDVAFQPFIDTKSGKVTGFEALARWIQADATPISPAVFIPLAENSGLMPLLGAFVLRRSCQMMNDIMPKSDLRVAVNISVAQLLDRNFPNEVLSILEQTGLPPHQLELEMTENVFADDVDQIREIINQLRNSGIQVSIDDFGTGYSSISYLRDFPLDTLKIDRSFVTALKDGGENIYSSIVTLARGLELSIIVEGVETKEELATVLRLGGDEVQGYFFAKPMLSDELRVWTDHHLDQPFQLYDLKQSGT